MLPWLVHPVLAYHRCLDLAPDIIPHTVLDHTPTSVPGLTLRPDLLLNPPLARLLSISFL